MHLIAFYPPLFAFSVVYKDTKSVSSIKSHHNLWHLAMFVATSWV